MKNLIFASMLCVVPVLAQVSERCVTTQHGQSDIRTICTGGGSYGVRQNPDGSVDELRRGRSIWTLGLLTWQATRVKPLPPEADPLTPPTTAAVVTGPPAVAADVNPVMTTAVFWTQRAENEQGGASNMAALIHTAVAQANNAYTASNVNGSLQLMVLQKLPYVETTISTDLSRLMMVGDGHLDTAHTLRDTYGADVVTLIGGGYVAGGYCGIGYLMGTPSPSFASAAFNVVDRACAASQLSYAHEVGHSQGLKHDPANAGCGSNCTGFNYGHNTASFRTVMSYGGQPRIQRFSNPSVLYNGVPTGTATRNNALTLTNNAPTVAAFRPASGQPPPPPPPPPPPCSYAVSPSSLSFPGTASTGSVSVTTTLGCGWSVNNQGTFATVTGGSNKSGTATVSVPANPGAARSGTIRVATAYIVVDQAASGVTCVYTTTPNALNVPQAGGTYNLTVTTTSLCGWSSFSHVSWASVKGATQGSGPATITVQPNTGAERTGVVRVATTYVEVTQAGQ